MLKVKLYMFMVLNILKYFDFITIPYAFVEVSIRERIVDMVHPKIMFRIANMLIQDK